MNRSGIRLSFRCFYKARLAILAIGFCASIAASTNSTFAANPQVAVVHASDFGVDEDQNNDGWPDAWRRVVDREHPKYIGVNTNHREEIDQQELQIVRRSLAQWALAFQTGVRPGDVIPEKIPPQIDRMLEDRIMNRCLEVKMDGGALQLESLPFPVDRRFTYRLGAELRCEELKDFFVQFSLVGIAQDSKEEPLGISKKISGNLDWQAVNLGNILVEDTSVTKAKIRIEVRPLNFQALNGKVLIDTVRVYRQPKLSVSLNPPSHIIKAGETITAECEITGLEKMDSLVQFQLRDVERRVVLKIASDVLTESQRENAVNQGDTQFLGTCHNQIRIDEPGYYELVIALNNTTKHDFYQVLPIVVLPKTTVDSLGQNKRFGLTIPAAGREISWKEAVRLARDLQIGNVKVPMWFDALQPGAIDGLANALDAFNSSEIKPIVVLDHPPPTQKEKFPADSGGTLLTALDQPAIWQPLLEPLLQRITLHVREFQLGWDHEVGLLNASKLPSILQNVRTKITAYEPESKLIMPCHAFAKESYVNAKSLQRYHLHIEPGLTAEEITNYSIELNEMASERWISLATCDPRRYTPETTIVDLMERMLAVVNSQFSVAFFNQSSQNLIFDASGRPGMLYLPIRNLAGWLNQCDRCEPIELPNDRRGVLLFQGDKTNLLLFPSDTNTEPFRFWLGLDLKAIDVWGRSINLPIEKNTTGKPVEVQNHRWPILIQNVNDSLIRWQNAVQLVSKDIVMTTTSAVSLDFQIKNPGRYIAMGSMEVIAPDLIREAKVDVSFAAPPDTEHHEYANISLRSDAAEGEVPLKLIIKLEAPDALEFEMESTLHVGLPGVRITSQSELTSQGDLVIDITIENQTGSSKSFDLILFVPDQPRLRSQVIGLKESTTRRIIVPNAKPLKDKVLRLSCEEIGTGRTINHLIRVGSDM